MRDPPTRVGSVNCHLTRGLNVFLKRDLAGISHMRGEGVMPQKKLVADLLDLSEISNRERFGVSKIYFSVFKKPLVCRNRCF